MESCYNCIRYCRISAIKKSIQEETKGGKKMPIYEYFCKTCNRKFEVLVLNSKERIECPACQSEDVEKLFSTFCSLGGSDKSNKTQGSNTTCPGGICNL